MLYAMFCYDDEKVTGAWTKEQDEAAMTRLLAVQDKLRAEKRLGPVARLMTTPSAKTVRKGKDAMVIDGPFAETKEQLLGFFIIDCESLDEAIATAKELGTANGTEGCYEIRPLSFFNVGGELR